MATFVLGDIHGCFDTLRALWTRLPFNASADRLWLTGDLVNRGPQPLETLHWVREMAERLGPRFATVLGNHDLHLLRRAAGLRPPKPRDTLERILEAVDGDDHVEWVASRPLLHRESVEERHGDHTWCLVHAGLWPGWNPDWAAREARRAETWLADPQRRNQALDLRQVDHGPVAATVATKTTGKAAAKKEGDKAAVRRALHAFTELRTLRAKGRSCSEFSGPPEFAPEGCVPWFRHEGRATHWPPDERVVFGHWAALGYHRSHGVLALDTGAVWGGGLTAVRLEDGAVFFQETLEVSKDLPGGRG